MLVSCVYRPPESPTGWFDWFEPQLYAASKSGLNTVLTGDFNIDLSKNKVSAWNDLYKSFNFYQIIDVPTQCVKDCASLLDDVYVTDRKNVALFISNIAFSDHFPVGVVWRKPVTKSCTHHRYISYSKPINYDSYEIKYNLQSLINSIYYMKNLHNMVVNVLNNAIVYVKSSLPNITK